MAIMLKEKGEIQVYEKEKMIKVEDVSRI